MSVDAPVKVLNLSEEMKVRAQDVLYFKESIRTILREFMKEVAINRAATVKLWYDVKVEAQKQGVTLAPDEAFSFDFITERFLVVKQPKTDGG